MTDMFPSSAARKLDEWRCRQNAEYRKREPDPIVLLACELAIDLYVHLGGEGEG